jgi:antitoxin MazE
MTVKFREVGNSMAITIPKDIVIKCGLFQGMEANIEEENNVIIVKPIILNKKITIKTLFENYHGAYVPTEIDWGLPVGKEMW